MRVGSRGVPRGVQRVHVNPAQLLRGRIIFKKKFSLKSFKFLGPYTLHLPSVTKVLVLLRMRKTKYMYSTAKVELKTNLHLVVQARSDN